MFITRASFKIALESDTHIILVDMDDGRSLANDIVAVVARLDHVLAQGIGSRRVYFQATDGGFHEIVIRNGQFSAMHSCSTSQQTRLAEIVDKN